MGLFMMGALSSFYVKVSTPLQFTMKNADPIILQDSSVSSDRRSVMEMFQKEMLDSFVDSHMEEMWDIALHYRFV